MKKLKFVALIILSIKNRKHLVKMYNCLLFINIIIDSQQCFEVLYAPKMTIDVCSFVCSYIHSFTLMPNENVVNLNLMKLICDGK